MLGVRGGMKMRTVSSWFARSRLATLARGVTTGGSPATHTTHHSMPFLDWVNKNQAEETSHDVPYHLLRQEQTFGDAADNLLIQGDNL